jgi:hypothetical protein
MATNIVRGSFMHSHTSDQRIRSVAKKIYEINEEPDELMQMMMRFKKVQPVDSRKFEFNEERLEPDTVTVAAVVDGTTLEFSDADAEHVRKGMVLRKNDTVVTRVTDTPNYTTNRATVGSSTGFAVGDTIILAGIAGAEGDDLPPGSYFEPTLQYNYLQEVTEATERTRWARTENRYDAPLSRQEEKALGRLKRKCENVLWFGHLEAGTDAAGRKVLGTRGICETIASNKGSFDGGKLDIKTLIEMVEDFCGKSPSPELYAHCSPQVFSLFNQLTWDKMAFNTTVVKEFGVAIRKMELGSKTLNLVKTRCLKGAYANRMYVLDYKYFEVKTARDQETQRVQWMLEIAQGAKELNAQKEKVTYVTDIAANLIAEEAHFVAQDIDTI